MIDDLNDDNFLIYAMKAYNTPNCIMSEFEEDLKKVKYIKRLLRRYKLTGDLKERLILNHIIILSNVFGVESTVRILFFKLPEEFYTELKTFLLYLNYMPKLVIGINGKNIDSRDLGVDINIGNKLKNI